jgi:UDP-3-O-[3-hydroxymyristoyl] glucosamine N-acyltransferase
VNCFSLKGVIGSLPLDGAEVVRGAEIKHAAKLGYPLPDCAVPCGDVASVKRAQKQQGVVAIVTTSDLVSMVSNEFGLAISKNPLSTVLNLHEAIARKQARQNERPSNISSDASVSDLAVVADTNVIIESGCEIEPGAIIREGSHLCKNVKIGGGTVIGADAFHRIHSPAGQRIIVQTGGVFLGSGVIVQSNCTVSRAVFGGNTSIGPRTLIDSQVHVGHDCNIESDVIIANQVSLAGRVSIGYGSYIAPNSTISNGVKIGRGARVTIGSTVMRDVNPDETVTGYNSVIHEQWFKRELEVGRLGRKKN